MCFGEESPFSLFLQSYFSLTIVNKLLIEENTSQMFNTPGKTVMLTAYNNKTDIAFCFFSEEELAYDRRSQEQQKQMIRQHFQGEGWRTTELLDVMTECDDFYFDKLCQIRMGSWSKGRVALVGDARIARLLRQEWAAPWRSLELRPWPTRSRDIRRT